MDLSETTETKRDLNVDLAICSDIIEHSPHKWFVMHGTDVMSEDPPGSCELDSIAWASAPIVAEFIVEARTGWPHAIERAISAERSSQDALLALYDADRQNERLRMEVESLRMQRDSLEATLQHYRGYA